MAKKLSGIFLVTIILLLQVGLVFGNTDNVIDNAKLLDGDIYDELQSKANSIKTIYGMEPVILTIDDAKGNSSMVIADDYYDYNGFGVGSENKGILMLIDMDNRTVWISTTGQDIIDKYQPLIDPILEEITPYLSDGEYSDSCIRFLEIVENVERTGKISTYGQRVMDMMTSIIPYIVALVIGLIATGILTLSSKSKVTATGRNYESGDSFVLTNQADHFEHENTTRRAIPKNNNSSGGGGSHTGSSGTSHGGGGSSF